MLKDLEALHFWMVRVILDSSYLLEKTYLLSWLLFFFFFEFTSSSSQSGKQCYVLERTF